MENDRKSRTKHEIKQATLTPAEKYKQELRGLFGLERGSMPHDIVTGTIAAAFVAIPALAGGLALAYGTDDQPRTSPIGDPGPTPISDGLKNKASFHIDIEDFVKRA